MPISLSPGSPVRQLAAVLFADMAGFTAMMEADEQAAWRLRERMRIVMEDELARSDGRVVNFYGDGMLCLFPSAAAGVRCCIRVQRRLQEGPVVPVRMGMHAGEVCLDDQGVYGDCVNLASRVQALSVPGGILISDKVYDEVKNQPDIPTRDLGPRQFKHISRPVQVYAVALPGFPVPEIPASPEANEERSIAVLPFANMSADPDNEYFSDGVAEEILNALSQVEGLRVCARSSSFACKGISEDIRQVGQKLGVSSVLEGSVRRDNDKLRITARLVNTSDGYRIWSETFDGDLSDIFSLQDAISQRIVQRLLVSEGSESAPGNKPGGQSAGRRAREAHVPDLTAYNTFLKGRFSFNKSTPESIRKAIESFEAATQLDPGFTEAYCMLAYAYSYLGSSGHMPFAEAFGTARDYTLKALETDPNHAESYLALATVQFFHNWDFEAAERSIQKARSLGLRSSHLDQVHGQVLVAQGRFDEAVDKIREALEREPLSLALLCMLGDALAFGSRFEEAIRAYDEVIELDPRHRRAVEGKGLAYLAAGDLDRAIPLLEEYHQLVGDPLKGLSALGHAYALHGDTEKAMDCLARTRQREEANPNINLDTEYGFIYAGLKDYDNAFKHFQRLFERRMGLACQGMIYCVRYPLLQEMKKDPRFLELTSKLGIR